MLEMPPQEIERSLVDHACEIASTPKVTVPQLRADTERWGQRLKQAATTHFGFSSQTATIGLRLIPPRLNSRDRCWMTIMNNN